MPRADLPQLQGIKAGLCRDSVQLDSDHRLRPNPQNRVRWKKNAFRSACVQVCCVALQSDEGSFFHPPHSYHDRQYAERFQWGVTMTSTAISNSSLVLILLAGPAYVSAGTLDREENYQHAGPIPCEALDRNRDGLVSKREYAQLRDERRAGRQQRSFPARGGDVDARFERMDSNGDNAISREEFVAHQARRMQRRQARRERYTE